MREFFRPAITRVPIDARRYGGQWIAIWRRDIIDADADYDQLLGRLARRGLDQKAGLLHVPKSGRFIG